MSEIQDLMRRLNGYLTLYGDNGRYELHWSDVWVVKRRGYKKHDHPMTIYQSTSFEDALAYLLEDMGEQR